MPRSLLERLVFGWQLVQALASVEPAAVMTERLRAGAAARRQNFVARVEKDLWQGRRRPYRELLEIAGWDPDRVRLSVARHGLEATLEQMAGGGVTLDADEAKGRKPLVRRGRDVAFDPADLASPRGHAVPLVTSGSSGSPVRNPIDLDGFRLQASYLPAMLAALAVDGQPLALYYPAISTAGIAHMIAFALAGQPPAAWFCHLRPEAGAAVSPWRALLHGLVAAARLRGVSLPLPRLADIDRPRSLVDWLRRRAPQGAVVATFPGSALRVQSWARAAGLRLPRVTWILGGEPITARKRQRLEEDGHRVYPWYGAIDTGRIGIGCLHPASCDDMHLMADRFAAILLAADTGAGVDAGAGAAAGGRRLLLTSLVPELHRSMLNLDVGDLAEPLDRRCGCPFEQLGFLPHLHAVHSRQKLTVEGATIAADRVHSLASDLLPSACGGSPTDYQIVEEEDGNGFTRLVVRVHPALAADERQVIHAVEGVLAAATGGATAERLRRAGVVTVRREPPRLSHGGKSLPVERGGAAHG